MDNLFMLANVTCGDGSLVIDKIVPSITVTIVNAIKIIVPILLIIFGMMDLMKAVTAGDEKVMKEAQGKLIKRAVYGILVFLVIAIVQTVFATLGKADSDSTTGAGSVTGNKSCIACFISGTGNCTPADGTGNSVQAK